MIASVEGSGSSSPSRSERVRSPEPSRVAEPRPAEILASAERHPVWAGSRNRSRYTVLSANLMGYQAFHLAEPIRWKVKLDGKVEIELDSFPDWKIVTPLGIAQSTAANVCRWATIPIALSNSEYLLDCEDLILHYTGSLCDRTEVSAIAETICVNILSRLRFVSGQSGIRPNIVAKYEATLTSSSGLEANFYSLNKVGSISTRDYIWYSALTDEMLERAGKLESSFEVPIHNEILQDGLQALVELDFRRAILYAAIAVESFSNQCLQESLATAVIDRATRHRFVEVANGRGDFVVKDPVWEYLASGTDFSKLLHVRPLYLMGRSILVENEALYSKALKLYATRNKIAHVGEPPTKPEYLPVNSLGAKEALRTAVDVVRWFGDCSPYYVFEGFVEVENGVARETPV